MVRTDVAVIGVGAMGSMALWRLAGRGAQAIGFEQFAPGHDRGSSHGESRIIRTAYFEGAAYVPLVRRAFSLWRDLEREAGTTLLTLTGALMIGHPESAVVAGALASARQHGLAHTVLDATAMAARFPQHTLAADEVAVYEEEAGLLRPEAAILAATARAEALGATVLRQARVERIEPDADGVTIVAGGETYRARHAIVSAGAWLGALLPRAGLPLRVERQVSHWCRVADPRSFAPDRFPVFIRELPGGRYRYGFPSLDGETIKVGVHHEGATVDPEQPDRKVGREDVEPIASYIAACLRGVDPDPARSLTCMYTNTPDEHFAIGPLEGLPNLTLVSACSGHGFKFAPALGDLAADLALTGVTAQDIGIFSPARLR